MKKGKIFVCIVSMLMLIASLACVGLHWQEDMQKLVLSNIELQKQYDSLSMKFQEDEENSMILSEWVEQDGYDSWDEWWKDLQNYRSGYLNCDEKVLNGDNAEYVTPEQEKELKKIAKAIKKSRSPKELKKLVKQFNQIVEEIEKQKNKATQQELIAEETNFEDSAEATTDAYSWQVEVEQNYETPSSGLTQESGVNYHDGRTETYYSSNVLYHYQTSEWTVDDEGFYRTDDGYYVVAASDMPQGTTFEGSKGTCIVLDSGCDTGVTDYYVAW